jgi:hypothetical protein
MEPIAICTTYFDNNICKLYAWGKIFLMPEKEVSKYKCLSVFTKVTVSAEVHDIDSSS